MLSTDLPNNLNPANKVIADLSYTDVARFNTSVGASQPNLHEFNTVDDGENYLQPGYPYVYRDLTPYGGTEDGVIWDSCFQEISSRTGNPNFEWCWLDYYPEWDTTVWIVVGPNTTNVTSPKAGHGNLKDPFDPAHLNAIDKNSEGDYLISVRHADQILKIAGPENLHGVRPGTVLWQLGGNRNQFTVEGDEDEFRFSKQHHVRFISTTADETIFSVLDNAWEGCTAPSSNVSSGKIIAINNNTMTARLLRRYAHPGGETTPSQSSMQVLPNGNVFIGWGPLPHFTEFAADGKVLFHAVWTRNPEGPLEDHSYRAFKSPWVGRPKWPPKLVAYSHTCVTSDKSPLVAWVSWNGATEVRKWQFSISTHATGPWLDMGTFAKTGFETEVVLLNRSFPALLQSVHVSHAPFVSVRSLDGNGLELGSTISETFVPNRDISSKCFSHGCFNPSDRFAYDLELSCGPQCGRSFLPQIIVAILLFSVIEYCIYSYAGVLTLLVMPGIRSWQPKDAITMLDFRKLDDEECPKRESTVYEYSIPSSSTSTDDSLSGSADVRHTSIQGQTSDFEPSHENGHLGHRSRPSYDRIVTS